MIINVSFCDNIIYNGTICGWAEAGTIEPILCKGFDPRRACPSDYSQQLFSDGFAYCYKTNTTTSNSSQSSAPGTICGGIQRVFCGGTSTRLNCPNGYSRSSNYICYKNDSMVEDASGTYCGLWNAGEGRTCGGFPAGTCPNGYFPVNKGNWHICYKA